MNITTNNLLVNPQSLSFNATNNKGDNKKSNHLEWLALGIIAPFATPLLTRPLNKTIKNDSEAGINVESVDKAFTHMWKENNLVKKGVKFYFAPYNSDYSKFLIKNFGGAAYAFSDKLNINQIDTAMERASLSLHETGHVINHNCTKIGKMYKNLIEKISLLNTKIPKPIAKYIKMTPATMAMGLSTIFLLTGVLGTRKKKNESESQKFSIPKFIHNNLGKLTILAFSPILIDEATASIRALKATKKVAPEMLKPLGKNLALAFSSYVITTGFTLISVLAIRKYADLKKQNK